MIKDRAVRLTTEGKAKLEEELAHLQTVRLAELQARINDATEHGDVSDNSEYEDLKEEYIQADARLRELEHLLERAEIVAPPTDGGIGLGSVVTMRGDDGETETWRLVSPEEADTREGTISTDSPVGNALVGRAAGQTTTVETPAGPLNFTILRVE